MAGFVNRENRVPYYQRLFFEADKKHIRLWETIGVRVKRKEHERLILGTDSQEQIHAVSLLFYSLGRPSWYVKESPSGSLRACLRRIHADFQSKYVLYVQDGTRS
ncbi:hypothetical protein Golomagni_01938 [Golovinomyces magnicellulatus]|nr:hypothetical protein Golomagni_01938 [Golovinomyces magnicellulatus]